MIQCSRSNTLHTWLPLLDNGRPAELLGREGDPPALLADLLAHRGRPLVQHLLLGRVAEVLQPLLHLSRRRLGHLCSRDWLLVKFTPLFSSQHYFPKLSSVLKVYMESEWHLSSVMFLPPFQSWHFTLVDVDDDGHAVHTLFNTESFLRILSLALILRNSHFSHFEEIHSFIRRTCLCCRFIDFAQPVVTLRATCA